MIEINTDAFISLVSWLKQLVEECLIGSSGAHHIVRSWPNSTFGKNYQHNILETNDVITMKFCIYHGSCTIIVCVKHRHDYTNKREYMHKCILINFHLIYHDRFSGTSATHSQWS